MVYYVTWVGAGPKMGRHLGQTGGEEGGETAAHQGGGEYQTKQLGRPDNYRQPD